MNALLTAGHVCGWVVARYGPVLRLYPTGSVRSCNEAAYKVSRTDSNVLPNARARSVRTIRLDDHVQDGWPIPECLKIDAERRLGQYCRRPNFAVRWFSYELPRGLIPPRSL
jgi:hypothetical protein